MGQLAEEWKSFGSLPNDTPKRVLRFVLSEKTVLPKQSVYVDVVECRHPRLRSWCQQWRESSSLSIRTIKKVHRNNNSTHTKIYMSKSRVHAKVYVPFGISTPEICCPSVCQNWSGLPGFNLDGNTRGRDVLLRYYYISM